MTARPYLLALTPKERLLVEECLGQEFRRLEAAADRVDQGDRLSYTEPMDAILALRHRVRTLKPEVGTPPAAKPAEPR